MDSRDVYGITRGSYITLLECDFYFIFTFDFGDLVFHEFEVSFTHVDHGLLYPGNNCVFSLPHVHY